eukprot:Selendium_serpulae@DN4543_c1_g1_i3.p2
MHDGVHCVAELHRESHSTPGTQPAGHGATLGAQPSPQLTPARQPFQHALSGGPQNFEHVSPGWQPGGQALARDGQCAAHSTEGLQPRGHASSAVGSVERGAPNAGSPKRGAAAKLLGCCAVRAKADGIGKVCAATVTTRAAHTRLTVTNERRHGDMAAVTMKIRFEIILFHKEIIALLNYDPCTLR